jgi:hypothetical protein
VWRALIRQQPARANEVRAFTLRVAPPLATKMPASPAGGAATVYPQDPCCRPTELSTGRHAEARLLGSARPRHHRRMHSPRRAARPKNRCCFLPLQLVQHRRAPACAFEASPSSLQRSALCTSTPAVTTGLVSCRCVRDMVAMTVDRVVT